jgi:uncharacterized protein with PQ loop repeat
MEWSQIIGYIGTCLALLAYIPQIYHLVEKKCAAAISLKAFVVWFLATLLLLIHAITIHSIVFITFQIGSLIALSLILVFGYKYRNKRCTVHRR